MECRQDDCFSFPAPDYANLCGFVPEISKSYLPKSGSEMENALLMDKRHRRVRKESHVQNSTVRTRFLDTDVSSQRCR